MAQPVFFCFRNNSRTLYGVQYYNDPPIFKLGRTTLSDLGAMLSMYPNCNIQFVKPPGLPEAFLVVINTENLLLPQTPDQPRFYWMKTETFFYMVTHPMQTVGFGHSAPSFRTFDSDHGAYLSTIMADSEKNVALCLYTLDRANRLPFVYIDLTAATYADLGRCKHRMEDDASDDSSSKKGKNPYGRFHHGL